MLYKSVVFTLFRAERLKRSVKMTLKLKIMKENFFKELEAFFETDEGKESIVRFKEGMQKEASFKKRWKKKFKNYLKDRTDEELSLLFDKFHIHAEKRRDILWKQCYDGESSLYTPLLDSFSKLGTKAKKSRYSMFTTSMYIWRGYQVESYCGQGCFHSLSKI